MARVQIYSTRSCPYCVSAKQFFDEKGIPYEEQDLTGDAEALSNLVEKTKQRTVPQIFIGDTFIGGYDDLIQADREGKLEDLLQAG